MPNIKGPDGKVISFPDGTSDADIASAFEPAVAGAGAGGPPQLPAHSAVNMQPSLLGRDQNPSTAANVAKGAAKGVLNTLSGADSFASKIPGVGKFLTTPIGQSPTVENSQRAMQAAQEMATPHNTAQSIGRGLEQAGEFLIPGAAEKELGLYGASKLPMLGKYAAPIAKLGAQALGAGAVNATQGGSFGAGAATGAAGGLLGMGLQKAAPIVAETAMGARAADRTFGRSPGLAIMDRTTGSNPGKIAQQGFDQVAADTNTLNTNALNSPRSVDLQPARQTAQSFADTADLQNNKANSKEIGDLYGQLTSRGGQPIPQSVSAHEGLALKRGVDALSGSWNPAAKRELSDFAISKTRNAMNAELEGAIPEFRPLNSRISEMLPVAQRAGATDLNAGVLQRTLGRFAKPTGALIGGAAGAGAGYREGGTQGALLGGLAGLVAPEILSSPTTMMMGARSLYGPGSKLAVKAAVGTGLQMGRPSLYGK
jgi:hypothetical protein